MINSKYFLNLDKRIRRHILIVATRGGVPLWAGVACRRIDFIAAFAKLR
jgi:hypothetical protein